MKSLFGKHKTDEELLVEEIIKATKKGKIDWLITWSGDNSYYKATFNEVNICYVCQLNCVCPGRLDIGVYPDNISIHCWDPLNPLYVAISSYSSREKEKSDSLNAESNKNKAKRFLEIFTNS